MPKARIEQFDINLTPSEERELSGDIIGMANANTVKKLTGVEGIVTTIAPTIKWESSVISPTITQAPSGSNGQDITIKAQDGNNSDKSNGGNIVISSGLGFNNGKAGDVNFQTSGATIASVTNETHLISFPNTPGIEFNSNISTAAISHGIAAGNQNESVLNIFGKSSSNDAGGNLFISGGFSGGKGTSGSVSISSGIALGDGKSGDLFLSSGSTKSGAPGNVIIGTGNNETISIRGDSSNALTFFSSINPIITQLSEPNSSGRVMTIAAQNGGADRDGGLLQLLGGNANGEGTSGGVLVRSGTNGNAGGNVNITASTGSDSNGSIICTTNDTAVLTISEASVVINGDATVTGSLTDGNEDPAALINKHSGVPSTTEARGALFVSDGSESLVADTLYFRQEKDGTVSAVAGAGANSEIQTLAQVLAKGNATEADLIVSPERALCGENELRLRGGNGPNTFGGIIDINNGNETAGGAVNISGGSGGSAGIGGSVFISGGTSGAGTGTNVSLIAGQGGTSSHGGNIIFTSGQGPTSGHGDGGSYLLTAGAASGHGEGGGFIFTGGSSKVGVGGSFSVTAGSSSDAGVGGAVSFVAGSGGTTGIGGKISFVSGSGGDTSGNAGNIELLSGISASGLDGSISLFAAAESFHDGERIVFVGDASATPTKNPNNGGFMYSVGGAGTWHGSSGTATTFGPARHCPRCKKDFILEAKNMDQNWHSSICIICLIKTLDDAGISPEDYVIQNKS